MAKKYDLSKSSDMRRLQRDMEKQAASIATESAMSRKYDISCPHCQSKVSVLPGRSRCPRCGNEINLKLDIHL